MFQGLCPGSLQFLCFLCSILVAACRGVDVTAEKVSRKYAEVKNVKNFEATVKLETSGISTLLGRTGFLSGFSRKRVKPPVMLQGQAFGLYNPDRS